MSDDRRDEEELSDWNPPTDEEGLGLTEEFARIEAELQEEKAGEGASPSPEGRAPAARPGGGGDAREGEDDDFAPPPPPARRADREAGAGEPVESAPDAEPGQPAPEPGAPRAEGDGRADERPGPGKAEADPEEDAAQPDSSEPTEESGEQPGAQKADPEDGAARGGEAPEETRAGQDAPPSRPKPEPGPHGAGPPPGRTPPRPRPIGRPLPTSPRVPAATAAAAIPPEELEDRTPSLWLRFLAGSVLIVSSVAAAVVVATLLWFSDLVEGLTPIPGVKDQLEAVGSGEPQTILIIGSDKRPDMDDGRSDTTMLLRVDPDNDILSLFSLPRDLKVDIPGYGIGKLNEAYAEGGASRTLRTVKATLGIEVNHIVEVNFQGFADAVNAIGCVFVDADRRYFNDNTGLGPEDEYAEIHINAGYQRLCGLKALQYVRYRHADTDIVRAARQQDFLREARQNVQPRELLPGIGNTGNELIDIFTEYTDSDISKTSDVIGILKSFIAVRDVPVNEIHFEGELGESYVTASSRQIRKAKKQFLEGEGSAGPRGGEEASSPKRAKRKKAARRSKSSIKRADVVDAEGQFDRFARTANRRSGIPVFHPTVLVPGSTYSPDSRAYDYRNDDDRRMDSWKIVISREDPMTHTEYYGVMGTEWDDPPILRNPSEIRTIDGRDYELFYDGNRLRLIGWRDGGNSYWINNTLLQTIDEDEMLAMATSMNKVG